MLGINYQPVTFAGRCLSRVDPMRRTTMPDVDVGCTIVSRVVQARSVGGVGAMWPRHPIRFHSWSMSGIAARMRWETGLSM